jgi:hypothetical protein
MVKSQMQVHKPIDKERGADIVAIQIMHERPNFKLFTNNSQNFAQLLLEKISPGSTCPDTIQNVLERWLSNDTEPNQYVHAVLPGAYPIEPREEASNLSSSEELEWEGCEVSFEVIKQHYDINWQSPLGQGSYGKVLEVRDPLFLKGLTIYIGYSKINAKGIKTALRGTELKNRNMHSKSSMILQIQRQNF